MPQFMETSCWTESVMKKPCTQVANEKSLARLLLNSWTPARSKLGSRLRKYKALDDKSITYKSRL